MIDKSQVLEELLEAMIAEDEDITVRAVCRRSDGIFKHATDITRNETRNKKVKSAIAKQETIRTAVNQSSKKSRAELEKLVAVKNAEIAQLQADKELLTASHRKMILAVAQMGGLPIWRQFFERYQEVLDKLDSMEAIPSGEVVALPPRKC
ncbi:hypothetical protein [Rhizobium beringeri]|uniref:hypothetical protein n=1 Tax=Rhizobium beringeri TaxID=3019934 RepID=UPI002E0DDD30|nr:hypothetical protein U8P75_27645 [Rhizobium beringeri]WSH82632.1 hypothetical protein U8P69_25760 [Rhizobium beringeri]